MIYNETLLEFDNIVAEAVSQLVNLADQNQKNDNDILLVVINGWRNSEYEMAFRNKKISPFMFGPGLLGHCFTSIYEFYDIYRKGINFKSKISSKERNTEEFKTKEKLSIDVELMIYLKFWEADLILFKIYNLVQLALGQPYDWNLYSGLIGQRRKLIKDQIQNPLTDLCPKLAELINETYSTQIRNAIAHSKYFHGGKMIHLGNKSESKNYILSTIKYEEWEIRFHKVLLIFNHLINNINRINNDYIEKAKDKHWGLAITIPEKTHLGLNKIFWLKYDFERKDWYWNTQK